MQFPDRRHVRFIRWLQGWRSTHIFYPRLWYRHPVGTLAAVVLLWILLLR